MEAQAIIALVVLATPLVCSAISAIWPSTSRVMKIIDTLAVNVGKARNDPKVQ